MICKTAIGAAAASLISEPNIMVEVQQQELVVVIGIPGLSASYNNIGVVAGGRPDDTTSIAWNSLGVVNGVVENSMTIPYQTIGVLNGTPDANVSVAKETIGVLRGVAPSSLSASVNKIGVILTP